MKLKYYLRGLGIGIVVSVCVLSAAFGNRKPMTDEEIKARAAELGMIENSIIKDAANKDNEIAKNDADLDESVEVDENTDVDNANVEDNADETADENTGENADENTVENVEENTGENVEENTKDQQKDVISITVVSGDSSWTVSKRMEEAGLIESAKDFDTHLCRYGYDKKISVGTYKIPIGASHEEMAKILTKMD